MENTTENYDKLLALGQEQFEKQSYQEAIKFALEAVNIINDQANVYELLGRCYFTCGEFAASLNAAKKGIALQADNPLFSQLEQTIVKLVESIETAIEQVSGGKHSTKELAFIEKNTLQLIEYKSFSAAVAQLNRLSEARKLKTVNILWIGEYLKNIYFIADSETHRNLFTREMLSEILFYYLKACKLFEPEYKIIQEAMKVKRAAEREKEATENTASSEEI